MAWPYVFVFLGAFLFDVVPFPFLPAFTVMIFLQVRYGLSLWPVLFIGVAGSILGRYLLTLYIPALSGKYFKPAKNEDVQFLGEQLKARGWKSQLFIVGYSLLPLPTTPLFLAGGMARIGPRYIIPAFFVGKLTSDSVAVSMGRYASQNIGSLRAGLLSWESILGLLGSGLLLSALLFIDWRSLIQKRQFVLNFRIFN
jgi:membrane protein YqaA with SNARE-associated domain